MPIHFKMNCPMDWEAMRGSNERRLCDSCGKHVTHLSNMTPDAALAFLQRTAGTSVCVRAEVDARGAVRFAGGAMAAAALFATGPALADGSIPNLIAPAATTADAATTTNDTDGDPDGTGPTDEVPTDVTDTDCTKTGPDPDEPDLIEPLMGDIAWIPPAPAAAAAEPPVPAE